MLLLILLWNCELSFNFGINNIVISSCVCWWLKGKDKAKQSVLISCHNYVVHQWPALCTTNLHCLPMSVTILHVCNQLRPWWCTIRCCQSSCFVCIYGTYALHQFSSTELRCVPLACPVHHTQISPKTVAIHTFIFLFWQWDSYII